MMTDEQRPFLCIGRGSEVGMISRARRLCLVLEVQFLLEILGPVYDWSSLFS